jgi:eukaryotic-like serine/threonine-protein kinase
MATLDNRTSQLTPARKDDFPTLVPPPRPDTITVDLASAGDGERPTHLGRYRITATLGSGGFGVVYRGHDDELQRDVAIKVPHRNRIDSPEDAEAYLAEARVLASLEHPAIVPVHDVGRTQDGLCFVVSRFIEGCDLSQRIKQSRLSHPEAATLVAAIAEALHHSHKRGLVHRDVKPGNILLDAAGAPYLADFGLALKEADHGKAAGYCGTPAYMSPEQANGEGHRVDGRSDLFSLGVVFYEMLTGQRPFRGNLQELLTAIATEEARPPRQIDDSIPKELERVCLKALAKRATDRYTTARDLADDLRHFLDSQITIQPQRDVVQPNIPALPAPESAPTPSTATSSSRLLKIVPKGLRSFDAHDADFFLELLPGPRDRDGLPDSIRFWKTRIEETDPDNTFSVGMIYGPSGCGKSSLVKAGLLPRLSCNIVVVHVEASSAETETRLLNGLRKRCPALSQLSLKETLAALRRGQGLSAGKKVLLVVDQFEQWLHAHQEEENTELVQALRQCDGGRVQCIVMVRDDFWMAATRFMRQLEIRLLEGANSAAADLFDRDHARKVLAAFGRAFGKLPDKARQTTKEQQAFLDQAVAGLSREGKVICVRLALFVEMMKGKTWTPASLKDAGGVEGVGATFLEETFSAAAAPPEHRRHQKAARAVLKALLPESGSDIKGHMRSRAELLAVSGCSGQPGDFDDLIRILDGQLRLITPTDPEGNEGAEDSAARGQAGGRFYQLTHDYLVHSLRDWLTRKQKETRRGRAELLLADRAAVWNGRPEDRQLPSLWQFLSIRRLTREESWTPPQRTMMRRAARYHAVRAVIAAVLLALVGWGVLEGNGRVKALALRDRLLDANTNEVPKIVADVATYRRWLNPLLEKARKDAEAKQDARKQLHASLGLLDVDPDQVPYLYGRLINAATNEVLVIRDALDEHKYKLLDKLWAVAAKPEMGQERQRLRAAAALAKYDPNSDKWAGVQDAVASDMVVSAVNLPTWLEAFRPVSARLLTPLAAIFRDGARQDRERALATDILADYAADSPEALADLLMDADEKQFLVIYTRFRKHGDRGLSVLIEELGHKPTPGPGDVLAKQERLAKRHANAAVALLKMGRPEMVWPLLKHSPDPGVRSYLIHRFSSLRVDAKVIVERLHQEDDDSIRRALILSLGEFSENQFPAEEREPVTAALRQIYRVEPDAGLHAAAEWLLRRWNQEDWLGKENSQWASQHKQREQDVKQALTIVSDKGSPLWCVNGQGQTMVVFAGRVDVKMGSPAAEKGRETNEGQHKKRIGRAFAVASKVVTVGQYKQFDPGYPAPNYLNPKYTAAPDLPVVGVHWFEAAAYCNWLSAAEGIPRDQWCYETNEMGKVTQLKEKYLSLTGYRLPTESEMEYATRAGASTSRYHGETDELLPRYAWCQKNSEETTHPVGMLKPNDYGLFDALGNVYTWCQESYQPYPTGKGDEAVDDRGDGKAPTDAVNRGVLRSGSFNSPLSHVRCANRINYLPTGRFVNPGFRVARTIAP